MVTLVEEGGINYDDTFFQFFPYFSALRQKPLSVKGAPPFIPNSIIEEELRLLCKLNGGGLHKIMIRNAKDIYAHIDKFTRQVPILVPDELIKLPSHIEIMHEKRKYRLKIEVAVKRCHLCKREGHFARECLDLNKNTEENTNYENSQTGTSQSDNLNNEIQFNCVPRLDNSSIVETEDEVLEVSSVPQKLPLKTCLTAARDQKGRH